MFSAPQIFKSVGSPLVFFPLCMWLVYVQGSCIQSLMSFVLFSRLVRFRQSKEGMFVESQTSRIGNKFCFPYGISFSRFHAL